MPRFFTDPSALQNGTAVLTGDAARHMAVLRLRPGEAVTLSTSDGWEHHCTLSALSGGEAVLDVVETVPNNSEPKLRATVFMAYAKADKLEHVIQKATELGAAAIVAFPSQRCVSRPEDKALKKKLERWQAIAQSAAEQSGRGIVPPVTALSSWQEALHLAAQAQLGLFFYENETQTHLADLMTPTPDTVSIFTGPEGGFSPQEVQEAQAAGLRSCSLGPRILRCETAPLCALSALLYAAGEL